MKEVDVIYSKEDPKRIEEETVTFRLQFLYPKSLRFLVSRGDVCTGILKILTSIILVETYFSVMSLVYTFLM